MSQQARVVLEDLLQNADDGGVEFGKAAAKVSSECGVAETTGEIYVRQHAEYHKDASAGVRVVTGLDRVEEEEEEEEGASDSVNGDGTQAISQPAGERTGNEYSNLGVLEDVGHPLVPEDETYYRRRVQGTKTDVQVISQMMSDPDYGTLLIGEAGVGKDACVRDICSGSNRPMVSVNFSAESDLVSLLIGHYTPSGDGFEFREGLLTRAVKNGYVFVADEINAAEGETLVKMNSLLVEEGARELTIPQTNEVVEPHEEFRFVATMNPPNSQYAGTKRMNTAFMSRFYPVELEEPSEQAERDILRDKSEVTEEQAESLVDFSEKLREEYRDGQLETWVSTRDLIKIARLSDLMGLVDSAKTVIGGIAEEPTTAAESSIDKAIEMHL